MIQVMIMIKTGIRMKKKRALVGVEGRMMAAVLLSRRTQGK